jgi:hypothetical protein
MNLTFGAEERVSPFIFSPEGMKGDLHDPFALPMKEAHEPSFL